MNEINYDVLKRLITIVERRIKQINKSIASNKELLQRVDEYDVLISTIQADSQCFASTQFNDKLNDLLSGIEIHDKKKLEELIEKLSYLNVIASSIINGYYKEYNEEEKKAIQEIMDLILYFKSISSEQKAEQRTNVTKSNEELEKCEALYDKLRNGVDGVEHLDKDIPYLMQLIGDESIEFKKDVLVLIQKLSKIIHNNIINQIEDVLSDEEEEEENQEVIDDDLIRGVFEKYGFNYDFLTDKHKFILSKISLVRIESVLRVISTNPEYQFVMDYEKYKNERGLFLVIRYATKETLEYLIKDARSRGVSVEDIFGVNGVYKKVSKRGETLDGPSLPPGGDEDEHLNGSYEYYIKNAKFFDKLSLELNAVDPSIKIDFFKCVLKNAPEVLALPNELVSCNVALARLYGVKMVRRTRLGECIVHTPTMYTARHFEEFSDILIENGLYDYLVNYPSVVKDEQLLKRILYFKAKGKLERNQNGTIKEVRSVDNPFDLDDVVNRNNISKYATRIPREIFEFVNDEKNYGLLGDMKEDSIISAIEKNPNVKIVSGVMYDINGVIVSRYKFRKIWYLITVSGFVHETDIKDLLMYALTYNSYYSDEQLEILERFVKGFNLGGTKLWGI